MRLHYVGDYELSEEIGRGGMGIVFRARQVSLNRAVAVKLLSLGQLAGPEQIARFLKEAEAAASLDHPNIVPVYEVGQDAGSHYFSMKLIEGTSLDKEITRLGGDLQQCIKLRRLERGRPVPGVRPSETRGRAVPAPSPCAYQGELDAALGDLRTAVRLLAKVARAVHYSHQRGILHRDLKPSNILIDRAGEPYVTDFGLAKHLEGSDQLTLSGAIVGTPHYMAPELAAGRARQATAAADIYSLGAVLYHLTTGQPPFAGAGREEVLRRVTEQEPPRPRSLNRRLDRDLETICLKAMEKAPERRYPTAEALAQDLEHWLNDQPIVARPVRLPQRALRWSRRHPLAVAAVVCVIAGLAITAVIERERHKQRVAACRELTRQYRRADALDWPCGSRDFQASGFVPGATRPIRLADYAVGWETNGVREAFVGDVTGGPELEIVVEQGDAISVLSSAGALLHHMRQTNLGCLGDVNADGKMDIVTGTRVTTNLAVSAFSGSGEPIGQVSSPAGEGDTPPAPGVVADIDGDGVVEVVAPVNSVLHAETSSPVGRRGLEVIACGAPDRPWTWRRKWFTEIGPWTGPYTAFAPNLAVFPHDLRPRLLHGSRGPNNLHLGSDGSDDGMEYVFCYDAATGPPPLWRRQFRRNDFGFYDANVFLPDLNGDGVPELVAVTSRHGWQDWTNRGVGTLRLLDPRQGSDRRRLELRQSAEVGVTGNLDGEPGDELVIETWNGMAGSLRAFGKGFRPKGEYWRSAGRWRPWAICDLDGDHAAEVIAVFRTFYDDDDDALVILNSRLDAVLWERPFPGLMRVMVVDFENDGVRELVACSGGKVIVLRNSPAQPQGSY
ncbi:MAG TPA: protein kinase [Verrucomicrobiota bacterium]|nr:protein kinase [Verrucomicrobiota bacterium]